MVSPTDIQGFQHMEGKGTGSKQQDIVCTVTIISLGSSDDSTAIISGLGYPDEN